jgi:hypothetical protein
MSQLRDRWFEPYQFVNGNVVRVRTNRSTKRVRPAFDRIKDGHERQRWRCDDFIRGEFWNKPKKRCCAFVRTDARRAIGGALYEPGKQPEQREAVRPSIEARILEFRAVL